jgi:hypothetical protein
VGSLRSFFREDNLIILNKSIRKSYPVKLTHQDHEGYKYLWDQGPFKFCLEIYLARDEETRDWTYTTVRVTAETRILPDPGDDCDYYTIRDFFKKSIPEAETTYAYALGSRNWGIETDGIFALLKVHPDFPDRWEDGLLPG